MLFLIFSILLIGGTYWYLRRETERKYGKAVRVRSRPVSTQGRGPSRGRSREVIEEITHYTHDEKTAKRLLLAVKKVNPNKGIDWCKEKVISDITRDRQ